jgi:hypothetical protein
MYDVNECGNLKLSHMIDGVIIAGGGKLYLIIR